MIPERRTLLLKAVITGNQSAVEMFQADKIGDTTGPAFGGDAIEAGGRIDLGTATTVEVLVKDALGRVLHSAAAPVTADKDVDPIARGIKGPLTVTTTNISNAAHTLTVYWSVRK